MTKQLNSKNVSGFDYFDKIYCVSLPESPDRWKAVSAEFARVGIRGRVEKIYAPRPPPPLYLPNMRKAGQYGCTMSHLKLLGNAMKDTTAHVLIFEDDIKFHPNISAKLSQIINHIPSDWEIIYLGGLPVEPLTPAGLPGVFHASDMRGSYGYAVNYNSISKLFNLTVDSLMSNKSNRDGIYDFILGQFSVPARRFAVYPLLTIPTEGKSLIQNGFRNYEKLIHSKWELYIPEGIK